MKIIAKGTIPYKHSMLGDIFPHTPQHYMLRLIDRKEEFTPFEHALIEDLRAYQDL
jgi:hypothetical protein